MESLNFVVVLKAINFHIPQKSCIVFGEKKSDRRKTKKREVTFTSSRVVALTFLTLPFVHRFVDSSYDGFLFRGFVVSHFLRGNRPFNEIDKVSKRIYVSRRIASR